MHQFDLYISQWSTTVTHPSSLDLTFEVSAEAGVVVAMPGLG